MGYLGLLLVGCLLDGCASDVVMIDPRTGETMTCPASLGGMNPWSQQERCIGDHIAGGWARTDQP